jgi:hypothetical protein
MRSCELARAGQLKSDRESLPYVMKRSDLKFGQIEPLTQHIHADDNPGLSRNDLRPDCISLLLGSNPRVYLDWVKFRILAIALEDFLRSADVRGPSHQDVAQVRIRSKLLHGCFGDCRILSRRIELRNRRKANLLEVALFLGFSQRERFAARQQIVT